MRFMDPWDQPGDPQTMPIPGWWQVVDKLPWPGAMEDGEDPARLPGVSAILQNALDRWDAHYPATTWAKLQEYIPLDPGFQDELAELKEEKELRRSLPFLEAICQNPRTHLRAEEFREPLARVRRITARTVQTLSAHSEDWQAITFRGVRPSRLLAQVTEEDWAIYENRALITLVSYLTGRISLRIAGLHTLLTQLEIAESHGEFVRGSRFRRDRLCLLLKEAFTNPPGASLVRALLAGLESRLFELNRLRASPLSREARHFSPVRPPLRSTNLFRGSDHYRRVESLWRVSMESVECSSVSTFEQLEKRRQDRIRAQSRLVCLLTLRALKKTLRFGSIRDDEISQPLCWGRDWRLRCHPSGLLTLEKGSRVVASVLPICAGRSLEREAQVDAALALRPLCSPTPRLLCVWLEGSIEDVTSISHTERNSSFRHVTVSPLRLESEESILRFVREAVYGLEWPELPMRLNLSPEQLHIGQFGDPAWGSGLNGPPNEDKLVKLKAELGNARNHANSAEVQLEQVRAQLRQSKKGAPGAQDLERRRRDLMRQISDTAEHVGKLETLLPVLEDAKIRFEFSMRCPCCAEAQPARIISTRFRCVTCETEWGRLPKRETIFIRPKGLDPSCGAEAWGADWIPAQDEIAKPNGR